MTRSGKCERTLVVVFGAAVRPDGTASPALARRVGYATAVAQADPAVDLFLSGGIGKHPPSEARVMAQMLEGAVSVDRLVLDEASSDTLETVLAAAAYGRRLGYSEIQTCTDAYHQTRARMLFRLTGFAARPVQIAPRGPRQLQAKMWARKIAAFPYDAVAGMIAVWRSTRDKKGAA
jgi:vancomycin permeability regulator SanA